MIEELNAFFSPAGRKKACDAMAKRYSVRSYAAVPSIAEWSALSYAAQRCCLPGVRIVLASCDQRLFTPAFMPTLIRGAQRFAAVIVDESKPEYLLRAGFSAEAFMLAATAEQVGTCPVAGTYRKRDFPIPVKANESVALVIPLGKAEPGAVQPERRRKPLARICQDDPALWPEWARQAAQAVRIAPSALNKQPWLLRFEGEALTLCGGRRYGLDLGIALCHMELAIDAPHTYLPVENVRDAMARVALQRA